MIFSMTLEIVGRRYYDIMILCYLQNTVRIGVEEK